MGQLDRCVRHAMVALMLWASASAMAQEALEWQLDAQPLDAALVAFSRVSGAQLWYAAGIADGRMAPAVQGRHPVETALSRLLAGSGLAFRQVAPGTYYIERSDASLRSIGPVRVEGVQHVAARGRNGSRDPLATEGREGYASVAAQLGGPFPQRLHDVPRSVSVLGARQLAERNAVELSEALVQVPGVAARKLPGNVAVPVARGFRLGEVQYDGGATASLQDAELEGDLSAYDRIELLRGADGVGNGFISPAGILNLVRKRPLDRGQVVVDLWGGSWDQYRAQLDLSAKPAWNGRLRARGVAAQLDRRYHFDGGVMRRSSLYGIVEADLTPATVLGVGLQHFEQDKTPWASGSLPRMVDGSALKLRRSASTVVPWDFEDSDGNAWFVNLDHAFDADWQLRLRFNRQRNEYWRRLTRVEGLIDPQLPGCCALLLPPEITWREREQDTGSLRLNGRFELFGRRQQLMLGAGVNRRESNEQIYGSTMTFPVVIDIYHFDPTIYPVPEMTDESFRYPRQRIEQRFLSAAVALSFWDPLEITAAWRRADHYSAVISSLSWINSLRYREHTRGLSYLGLRYALTPAWNTYLSVSDVYVSNGGMVAPGGRALAPATGSNYEGGFKYANADDSLRATVGGYWIRQDGFPVRDDGDMLQFPDGSVCCFAIDREASVDSSGVEVEVVGAVAPGIELSALYAYNHNDKRGASLGLEEGVVTAYAPRHLLQLWSRWTPRSARLRRLSLGGGVHLQSGTPWIVGYDFESRAVVEREGTAAIFNARIGWMLDRHWNLALNLDNLLDRRYVAGRDTEVRGTYLGEPISYMLSLQGRF